MPLIFTVTALSVTFFRIRLKQCICEIHATESGCLWIKIKFFIVMNFKRNLGLNNSEDSAIIHNFLYRWRRGIKLKVWQNGCWKKNVFEKCDLPLNNENGFRDSETKDHDLNHEEDYFISKDVSASLAKSMVGKNTKRRTLNITNEYWRTKHWITKLNTDTE